MGSGRNLSLEERRLAVALYRNYPSERRVAGMLGCSRSAVHNAITRFRATRSHNDRVRPGRPQCTTGRQDRILVRHARQVRFTTTSELRGMWQNHHNVHASKSTVRRRYGKSMLFSTILMHLVILYI